MLFADDFVGLSDSKEQLQKLRDIVYSYCNKWRLKANSAVMVFAKEAVEGTWKWGEHDLPTVAKYTYLGIDLIDFASNGAWERHIKKVLDCGRKMVNQLHSVISNRDINLSAHRLLL